MVDDTAIGPGGEEPGASLAALEDQIAQQQVMYQELQEQLAVQEVADQQALILKRYTCGELTNTFILDFHILKLSNNPTIIANLKTINI